MCYTNTADGLMTRGKGLLFIVTQARRPRVKKCVSDGGLYAVRKAKGQEFAERGRSTGHTGSSSSAERLTALCASEFVSAPTCGTTWFFTLNKALRTAVGMCPSLCKTSGGGSWVSHSAPWLSYLPAVWPLLSSQTSWFLLTCTFP